MAARLASYEAFWPFYLSQHRNPVNRALHFVGTSLVLLLALLAIVSRNPWWLAALPFGGYGFAWIGHFFFERNRPATFTYPLWSLRGDVHMYALTWTGGLRSELGRAQELFPSAP